MSGIRFWLTISLQSIMTNPQLIYNHAALHLVSFD